MSKTTEGVERLVNRAVQLKKAIERAAELTPEKRRELDKEKFAVPGKRKLPIHDCPHVRSAMGRFTQTEGLTQAEKRAAVRAIINKAEDCGIDAEGFRESHKDLLS